jgi:RNAse (barnase) inhibitor barstar
MRFLTHRFVLDFSTCTSIKDAYTVINDKIGFSEFGYNLDALDEILGGGFGHFKEHEEIILVIKGRENGFDKIKDFEKILKVIEESEHLIKYVRSME